ncbi:MAG: peptidoglycan DD-metalloendopeptidase family protein [Alphaproteobacteria bacterium]
MLLVRTTWKRIQAFVAEQYHRHFPERQIYLRSRGAVRFVALSPRFQFMSVSIAFGAMLWVGVASASLIFGNEIIEHKDQQIADLRNIRSDLHDQLVRLEDDLIERAEVLQARQTVLDEMLERSDVMFGSLTDQTTPTVEHAETEPAPGAEPLPVGGPAEEVLPSVDAPAIDAPADKDADGNVLHDPISDELSALDSIQQELLKRFDEQIDLTISQLEKAALTAGLDLDAILGSDDAEAANQGGPLTPLDEAAASDAELMLLAEKVSHLETLEALFLSIPLLEPVESFYISSHYGARKDPFTKKWASHSGVDLAGGWKAPVLAGAAGTVTQVGWSGAYGRMVEVDHGNGFVTRYGHLREFLVKEGQVVQTGDKVGLMGNSGRSTGTHLHYEIRFDGAPLNPINFFEAAKYVQAI